jgi:hypothetical protein
MYFIVGLYLSQVLNVMLYPVVRIRLPFLHNEREFTMVSAARSVELIMRLRLLSWKLFLRMIIWSGYPVSKQ